MYNPKWVQHWKIDNTFYILSRIPKYGATSPTISGQPDADTKKDIDKCSKHTDVNYLYQNHCVAMAYRVGGKDVTWGSITMSSQFESNFYSHSMDHGEGPGYACGVWSFMELPCWD